MQIVGWERREMLKRYHIVGKSDLDVERQLIESQPVLVREEKPATVANLLAIAPRMSR
jgi:hypothetical protein